MPGISRAKNPTDIEYLRRYRYGQDHRLEFLVYDTAEEWALAVVEAYRPQFEALGLEIPSITISPGFTGAGSRDTKVAGECWTSKASPTNDTFHIFLNPRITDSNYLAHVIVHEVIHATVGLQCKHRGAFRATAKALGFAGKMTQSEWSDEARIACDRILETIGVYPRPAFTGMTGRKKAKTRLLKVYCDCCGYTMRITQKWLDIAIPKCPSPDCEDCEMTVDW